jgi:hypothetical protein
MTDTSRMALLKLYITRFDDEWSHDSINCIRNIWSYSHNYSIRETLQLICEVLSIELHYTKSQLLNRSY